MSNDISLESSLDRIASSLEMMPQLMQQTDPILLLLAGAAIGGLITIVVNIIIWRIQKYKNDNDRKKFIGFLLREEISRRWNDKIGRDLLSLFNTSISSEMEKVENVRNFCSDMKISEKDLPIIKMCYDKILEIETLFSSTIITNIVYAHASLIDICDSQEYAINSIINRSMAQNQSENIAIDDPHLYFWKQISDIVVSMNTSINLVLSEINEIK